MVKVSELLFTPLSPLFIGVSSEKVKVKGKSEATFERIIKQQ